MPKVLLINDNSEQNNWGAQATPYALKRMLHDAIPGLNIENIRYSWLTKEYRCFRFPLVKEILYQTGRRGPVPPVLAPYVNRLSHQAEFFPQIVDDFDYAAHQWLGGQGGPFAKQFMAAAEQADVVVHNGENSMYRNTTAGVRSLFLLWLAKTRLGKPSCEVNQTAVMASMTRPVMSGMAKAVLPLLDVVTAREVCSLHDLFELGVKNAQLVPDVVFYLDKKEYAESAFSEWARKVGLHQAPYFCLSASSLPMCEHRPGWESSVSHLVKKLKQMIPQAVLMAKDPNCLFLKEIAQETNSIYFGPEHAFQEIWPLLRDARFLVSGHFHYVIMGSMVGCPFVPLTTNNHKIQGVCHHLNWHITAPYDATALRSSIDCICEDVAAILEDRDALSHKLLKRSAELKTEAGKNALLIKELV